MNWNIGETTDTSLDEKKAYRLEIVEEPLWFSGYSVYRTAFCKKWLANKIFDPSFRRINFSNQEYYNQMCFDWELHHYTNLFSPEKPSLLQFEDAVKYFQAKNILHDLTFEKPKSALKLDSVNKSSFFKLSDSPILKNFRKLYFRITP